MTPRDVTPEPCDAGEPKPPVTPAEVAALPMRIRQHIHMLETDCDPSGTIRELAYAKDTITQLTKALSLRAVPPATPPALKTCTCFGAWRALNPTCPIHGAAEQEPPQ